MNKFNWEEILENEDYETPSEYVDELLKTTFVLNEYEINEVLDELLQFGADPEFVQRFSHYCKALKICNVDPDEEDGLFYYLHCLIEAYVRPEFAIISPRYPSFIETLATLGFHLIKDNAVYRLKTPDELIEFKEE